MFLLSENRALSGLNQVGLRDGLVIGNLNPDPYPKLSQDRASPTLYFAWAWFLGLNHQFDQV